MCIPDKKDSHLCPPSQTMAVNVSVPLDFAFKADYILLLISQIFAPVENAINTNHWPVVLRAMKGALSLSYRLVLLKSTLKDTSLAFGNAVVKLKFLPLSGLANRRARLCVQFSSNWPPSQTLVCCLRGTTRTLVH